MRFELNPDQSDLQREVRRFFAATAHDGPRRMADGPGDYDEKVWQVMAQQLGLPAVAVDTQYGGAGGTLLELLLVLEEAGRALLCQPLFASTVLASLTLQTVGDADACRTWLPDLAAGQLRGTAAFSAPGTAALGAPDSAPFGPDAHSPVRARRVDGTWLLDGHSPRVVDGHVADLVLVAAETSNGTGLFAVAGDAAGLAVTRLPALDPTRPLSRLDYRHVPANPVGEAGKVRQALARTIDLAVIALAAEQAGIAQSCLDIATAYAKTRVQFDRPIGSFQAVKHLLADMFVDTETARDTARYAAWSVSVDPGTAAELAPMTGWYVSSRVVDVAARTLQVLGAIGYTWEHDAHLYYKRALGSARLLTTTDAHLDRLSTTIGL